jgi:hypothetical protein
MEKQRYTYIKDKEIIERAIARNEVIVRHLNLLKQHQSDERIQLFLDEAVLLQKGVTEQLCRYRPSAPSSVMNTYSQYTNEDALELKTHHATNLDEIVDNLLSLNNQLIDEFGPIAEKEGPEDVREAFTNMIELVEHNARQMSMNAAGALDV